LFFQGEAKREKKRKRRPPITHSCKRHFERNTDGEQEKKREKEGKENIEPSSHTRRVDVNDKGGPPLLPYFSV